MRKAIAIVFLGLTFVLTSCNDTPAQDRQERINRIGDTTDAWRCVLEYGDQSNC